MADDTANRVTETDAHTLVDKLQAFEATLSPAEQELLLSVLQRAAGVEEDVQGHLLLDQFIRNVDFNSAPESATRQQLLCDVEPERTDER